MRKISRNDLYLALFTLPLYFSALVKYGMRIVLVLMASLILGILVESFSFRLQKKKDEEYGIVSWFLLPLVFAPAMPLWMILVSIFLALVISVVFFGGHGYRLFSPVALGWAIGSLSFTRPLSLGWVFPFPGFFPGKIFAARVPLMEHPLKFLEARGPVDLATLLQGNFPQPLSNAVPLITLACGFCLILFRVIDFRVLLSYFIVLVGLFSLFGRVIDLPSLHTLLVGNVLFAAFFVLPDRRLASRTFGGRWLTGALAAVLTFVIRSFSGFADGVFYAVLLTNIFSALIDEAVISFKYRRVSDENA